MKDDQGNTVVDHVSVSIIRISDPYHHPQAENDNLFGAPRKHFRRGYLGPHLTKLDSVLLRTFVLTITDPSVYL